MDSSYRTDQKYDLLLRNQTNHVLGVNSFPINLFQSIIHRRLRHMNRNTVYPDTQDPPGYFTIHRAGFPILSEHPSITVMV